MEDRIGSDQGVRIGFMNEWRDGGKRQHFDDGLTAYAVTLALCSRYIKENNDFQLTSQMSLNLGQPKG